ncbi:Disease resistance protein RML1A, partial [Glycine soja]
ADQPEVYRKIVKEVSEKIDCIPLHVADNAIGLEYSVQEVKSLLGLESDEVNMIRIYGISGIGKTTIACVVYNLIFSHFEGVWFLPDIREKTINKHGLIQLQEMLPSEILKEKYIKHAFKNNKVDPCYVNISNREALDVHGLPLALEAIGSHVFRKSLNECSSALDKYERTSHEQIHEILKVSYDEVGYVTRMLHAHGFHAEDGLRVLVDRSLIKIDASGFVRMHDLIKTQEENLFWFDEDIVHGLEENMKGTDKIEFIKFEVYNYIEVQWKVKAFKKMKNPRILIIADTAFLQAPSIYQIV